MTDTTTDISPAPARRPGRPGITEEQKEKYLYELARTGSKRHAACAASGNLPLQSSRFRKYGDYGEETFRQLEKRDPIFAEAVQDALAMAIGTLENLLIDRLHTPDTRPVLDRQGNVVGTDTSWRSANVLLLRALERHAPEWVQRKQIDGNQTVTVNHGTEPSRSGLTITAEAVKRLPPERQQVLMSILDEMFAAEEQAKGALPAPQEQPNV